MIHGGKTAQEFLDKLEDDWKKEKLLEVRQLILKHPQLKEGMNYGMLSYGDGTEAEPLFHLNAQKNYVSLYVGDIHKIDPDSSLLKGLNLGKGCIRISKSKKIPETGLKEFIQKAVDLWLAGEDTSC
ncbi:uncharacterized protein DUF1801 [Halanaerobium saccharolyticum]|uniref:Uncharacterized protein DUF1801 n=1 Tax=Halanaerobium saccharolyticum TaxID=43595 RepID=A0A4R7YZ85_9FIRM|nr:DUF1801 domain-containing protein [Halanaerobium saccharolyticum]RAK12757.1 uncharacterized protein DUF1801 [Halanaerobium saccharolyticum]TDW02970.1 uncharacterized protein DUF1801 [Halanaerobium saccharolyticum]TDX62846.1 uncharacterized protein DUF1801 [Halanaerobium saccharolyticum]